MSFSLPQLLVILVIVFIFFGSGKLPNVMSDLGKGLKSFKNAANDDSENEKKD